MAQPTTLGELKKSGYQYRPIKVELHENLIARMESGEALFPDVVGYETSVLPAIENAVLAGHDMIFLGERGQAKTRMIRELVNLLDEQVPMIAGLEIPEDPTHPVTSEGRRLAAEKGDALPIAWLHRSERYGEKLATPDVSVADLIGEIDPVKIAEGRYLADENAIHFGLIPRTNRGIFAINELPDLAEKVQVGLFNILEERDVQIKGFKVRLPLDVLIVASANPEDYTHRGRIITPLKDRFESQVRTHYPDKRETEIAIMEQEARAISTLAKKAYVPQFMKEIVAQVTFEARQHPEINQKSGVSVRMSIDNYENLIATALKRAIHLKEERVVPRISDLIGLYVSSRGKIELEYSGEEKDESEIVQLLIQRAVKNIFDLHLTTDELEPIIGIFSSGAAMEVSTDMPSSDYMDAFSEVPELYEVAKKLDPSKEPGVLASCAEFILEGLHLNNKLNKRLVDTKVLYQGNRPGF